MINNRHLIEPLLEFPHKDIFYFVQILQRKKDHPSTLTGSNNNSRLIRAYFINSIEKLEHQWDEMVKLANIFQARVSINLNPRNYQKAAFHLLQKVANQMSNGEFSNVHKAYTSVCGEYHSEIDKRWIVDIDDTDLDQIQEIRSFINTLHAEINNKPYRILETIPSKTGMHIITHPFNLDRFKKEFAGLEVHKNNPTNLYIP